jgi:8-hydroxy-5-deazaflavin:NADPH oxidoreductase
MRIAVLGTGVVGQTLGKKLVERGHQVRMGSRTADNAKAAAFASTGGPGASQGTFADAAAFGEVVLNCTSGQASLDALRAAGATHLDGKLIIDIANPLDFSKGMPASLSICNTDSLGERIQAAFPGAKVVKALNTMTCGIMADPGLVPGDHDVFISGNDAAAKASATRWLGEWFGWKAANVIDLGDITTARGSEMLLPIWLRLYGKFQSPMFNFHVVRGAPAK